MSLLYDRPTVMPCSAAFVLPGGVTVTPPPIGPLAAGPCEAAVARKIDARSRTSNVPPNVIVRFRICGIPLPVGTGALPPCPLGAILRGLQGRTQWTEASKNGLYRNALDLDLGSRPGSGRGG